VGVETGLLLNRSGKALLERHLLRAAWRDDPVTFHGEHVSFDDIGFLPKPAHDIPIWVGGGSERAYRRAVEKDLDGWLRSMDLLAGLVL